MSRVEEILKPQNNHAVADEIINIRSQLINLTKNIPMTRDQLREMDVVENRLWKVMLKVREIKESAT